MSQNALTELLRAAPAADKLDVAVNRMIDSYFIFNDVRSQVEAEFKRQTAQRQAA